MTLPTDDGRLVQVAATPAKASAAAASGPVYRRYAEPAPPSLDIRTQVMLVNATQRAIQLLNLLFAFVELTLLARVALVALKASTASPFVKIAEELGGRLAAPFSSMFHDMTLSGYHVEISTLAAMAGWGLGALIIGRIIRGLMTPRRAVAPPQIRLR